MNNAFPRPRPVWPTILLAGLVVGVLDITDPIVFYHFRGVAAIRIPQSIAAGWLGRDAFNGGWPAAALGLASHFLIATTAAAVFVLASRRWTMLAAYPWFFGAAYGLGVFFFMNFIVVPLSHTPPPRFTWPVTLNLLFAHVCLIGWPIGFFARRAAAPNWPAPDGV